MKTLLPPSTIGIIGGGQLGMMLVREAQRMGYRTVIWEQHEASPASRLADRTIVAPFDDTATVQEIARLADIITYEFENIDAGTVRLLEHSPGVFPSSTLLSISQNRLAEKNELQRRGFPLARFAFAPDVLHLEKAIGEVGLPVVVKTATAGYDGKGQEVIRKDSEVHTLTGRISHHPGGFVIEEFLDLKHEVSVIVARGAGGSQIHFPVAQNFHRENILYASIVPARISANVQTTAESLAISIAESVELTGVLCIEMFVLNDGRILINELAPRPHNSGHYSLDACSISQFEAQLRAICGLPLPTPELQVHCGMINILGRQLLRMNTREMLAIEGAALHLYGKTGVEPKRKMGHITVTGRTNEEVDKRLFAVEQLLGEKSVLSSLHTH